MSAIYEIPSDGEEEHVYCQPGPAASGGNGAAKGGSTTNRTNKVLILALCVHTVLIVGLFGVCTYLLQVPTADVVGQKDQMLLANKTSGNIQRMDRLVGVESEMVALHNALATAKSEISSHKKALDAAVSEVSDIKSALATAEETIVQLKETSQKPIVIFHVRDVSRQPTANSVIKFRTVVENVGGAYSQATGCFIAPAKGAYWFSAQLCTHDAKHMSPSLYIRDTLASRLDVGDTDWGDCGSVTAVATLEKRDTVCLKSGPIQKTDPVWSNTSKNSNNFMGAIIN